MNEFNIHAIKQQALKDYEESDTFKIEQLQAKLIEAIEEIDRIKKQVNFDGFQNLKSANKNIRDENKTIYKMLKTLEKQLCEAENCLLEIQFNMGKNEYIDKYFENKKD